MNPEGDRKQEEFVGGELVAAETAAAGSPSRVVARLSRSAVPEAGDPGDCTARYKLGVQAGYNRLDNNGTGALLRRRTRVRRLATESRKRRHRGTLQALPAPQGPRPADPSIRRAAGDRIRPCRS